MITNPNTTSGHPSWAQVAAGKNSALPTPLQPAFNKLAKEANCIQVSTKPSKANGKNNNGNIFQRYLPPRLVVAYI
jgi:hypothetical protein